MIKFYINANAHSFTFEIEQIYTLKSKNFILFQ